MSHREIIRHRHWKWSLILLLAVLAAVVYIVRAGNTDSWQEASCTVAGSRVVRTVVADSFRAIVMYRGEYHLRYTVEGREYYVWANSGWSDVDKQFVQDKVDSRADKCDFLIRYNPAHPSDSVAERK